jgi:hypothetical protein
MLGHPVFRDKIREWLKVLRKANCAVVLATQSISDAERSGIIDVLKESARRKSACRTGQRANREHGSSTSGSASTSARSRSSRQPSPKREYYVASRMGGACSTCRSGRRPPSSVLPAKTISSAFANFNAKHGHAWPTTGSRREELMCIFSDEDLGCWHRRWTAACCGGNHLRQKPAPRRAKRRNGRSSPTTAS